MTAQRRKSLVSLVFLVLGLVGPACFAAFTGNLFRFNGQLFERGADSRFRPLFVERASGRLLGATRPTTLREVLGFYRRNFSFFFGESSALVETLLRAHGIDPKRSARFPGRAPVGTFSRSESDPIHASVSPNGSTPPRSEPRPGAVASESLSQPAPITACRDLNEAVCANAPGRDQQAWQIDQNRRDLVSAFLRSTGLAPGLFQQAMGFFQQEGIRVRRGGGRAFALRDPSPFLESYQRFFNFVNGRFGEARAAVETVRTSLTESLETQPLASSTKQRMREVIRQVQIRFTPTLRDARAVIAFVNNCGPDGMSPGAYAVKATSEVTLCPGLLLQSAAHGQELDLALSQFVAHELGHHIDALGENGATTSVFSGEYARFNSCLKEKFPGFIDSQIDECAADHWGTETLVGQLRKRGLDSGAAFQAIKAAVSPLCGSPADREHPSGTARIQFGVGRHPEVRRLLGCGELSPEKPGCTLEGIVPRPNFPQGGVG